MRIGFGYDVHQLKEGYDLIIGGIKIPSDKGAVGHSDADTLIHAICDALLGAANMRDIGFQFPDTLSDYKNIDSKILLKKVIAMIKVKGYTVGNIDSTVCLQKPKISSFIPEMIQTLSQTIGTSDENISIKATTTEHLGFVGREDGIAAYAVCIINNE